MPYTLRPLATRRCRDRPERDQQLARERHDADAPHAGAAGREARAVPPTERALRLPAEPSPRELDREGAQVAVAGFADSLLAREIAARAPRAAQPRRCADLASVPKLAPREELRRVDPRPDANAAQREEAPHHRHHGMLAGAQERLACGDERAEFAAEKREAVPFAGEPGVRGGRERRPVSADERGGQGGRQAARRLEHHAVQGEQPHGRSSIGAGRHSVATTGSRRSLTATTVPMRSSTWSTIADPCVRAGTPTG